MRRDRLRLCPMLHVHLDPARPQPERDRLQAPVAALPEDVDHGVDHAVPAHGHDGNHGLALGVGSAVVQGGLVGTAGELGGVDQFVQQIALAKVGGQVEVGGQFDPARADPATARNEALDGLLKLQRIRQETGLPPLCT